MMYETATLLAIPTEIVRIKSSPAWIGRQRADGELLGLNALTPARARLSCFGEPTHCGSQKTQHS